MPLLRWGELAWPQIDALDRSRTVVGLALGAVEAHGPHLPLLTDGVISEAMLVAADEALDDRFALVALPPLDYSAAPFAADFAGTLSLQPATISAVIVDIGRALAKHGFRALAIANAHLDPAHLGSIEQAVRALENETELTVAFPNLTRKPWALRLTDEFKSGACHAGCFEGSIVMAAKPEWVREEVRLELEANPSSISDAIRAGHKTFAEAGGPRAYFGDPAAATATEGSETIRTLGGILAESIEVALNPGD